MASITKKRTFKVATSPLQTNGIEFDQKNRKLLTRIRGTPSLLEKSYPELQLKLRAQGNPNSQGTGNVVSPQESSFAHELESEGFTFIPKEKKNAHLDKLPESGFVYTYQANGSQAAVDFQTHEVVDKAIVKSWSYDLKHTTSEVFFLNDGWFHSGIIYIVSWKPKTSSPTVFIGRGEDIPTEEESAYMTQLLKLKKDSNSTGKKVGSLCPYIRFANRYTCERFTDEFTSACFDKVVTNKPTVE